ncbi:MAG: hypothetical protein Q4A56_07005 [Porphyromonadaceae bacterium]|nr:hypothetical protein [Porphyromonadaceae bacterium]
MSIVAVVMLSISGLIIYCYWFFSTRFELINNKFEIIDKRISISDNRFLWDTGASGTILFSNIKIDRIPIGLSFVWDTHYKLKICKLFFVKEYLDDSIRFENLIYTEVKENNVSIAEQKQNFGGILGMNVIKNYNWLLDFSKNTLNNFNISYKYDNLAIFKLEYKSKHKPCTSLDIEGIKLKNTLIDSGSDADIQLLPTDIEQINKIIPPDSIIEQFSSGLFSDSIPSKKYFYSRLKVNGLFIDTLTINESKKRKLGIGFFRKFDRVFWDSGSKEVRFYRD